MNASLRGTLGVPNIAIPQAKLANTEIPSRKSTKHQYHLGDIGRPFCYYGIGGTDADLWDFTNHPSVQLIELSLEDASSVIFSK